MPTQAADPRGALKLARVLEACVRTFAEGWRAPAGADVFADHFEPLMHPRILRVQPGLPVLVGMTAFPGEVRAAAVPPGPRPPPHGRAVGMARRTIFIELRWDGTLGGRRLTLHSCDRVTLNEGRAIERVAHYDLSPLLKALALTPSTWRRVLSP